MEAEDEINWDLINNKRTIEENKKRLEEMIRTTDIYNVHSFKDNLLKIYDNLLIVNEPENPANDNEYKNLMEEHKRKMSGDIEHIYNTFLQKKRGLEE